MVTKAQAAFLREVALGDERALGALGIGPGAEPPLDGRAAHLARIGALVAMDADIAAYQREVNDALAAGVSSDEVIDALVRVAPIVGAIRAMSAAPKLALALGYDVDAAFEHTDVAVP
jgi:4-carboxymuconolactone decarboxylase